MACGCTTQNLHLSNRFSGGGDSKVWIIKTL
jgi:hypothetical protein